ncbi:hypothetical protein BX661DRAFT_182291 [Kickxella alabastrina]|uniref:uncharacterized protein n=1 Tax=Kickxella alabastrina TaxID=61397 RepID=UPI002220C7B5|nr:uncharacterized protein BX661DRAFT_182291 [Kickxella alabastrina]KAI7827715.1 hypothetical protein BX661DRAFT_182291 [Kickxella alabastrina]
MATHRRRASKLSLEPNPFEQSFSLVRSEDASAATLVSEEASDTTTSMKFTLPSRVFQQQQQQQRQRPFSMPVSGSKVSNVFLAAEMPRQQYRVKLPPVTALSGPLHATDMSGVGPLSPAMLGGPAEAQQAAKGAARITPRLRLAEPLLHTGLTPYISGEAQPTVAATDGIKLPLALTTPGIQAMIRATIEGQEITSTPGGSLRLGPIADSTGQQTQQQMLPVASMALTAPPQMTASMAAAAAATKRQNDSTATPPAKAKRSKAAGAASRKSSTPLAEPSSAGIPAAAARQLPRRTEEAILQDGDSDAENSGSSSSNEKRKQFLERNALQRSKLQDRHDYMKMQNDNLRAEYLHMRELSLQLRAMLAAHRECPVAQSNGVFGVDNLPHGMPNASCSPLANAVDMMVAAATAAGMGGQLSASQMGLPTMALQSASGVSPSAQQMAAAAAAAMMPFSQAVAAGSAAAQGFGS